MQIQVTYDLRQDVQAGARLWFAWLASKATEESAPEYVAYKEWRNMVWDKYGVCANVDDLAKDAAQLMREAHNAVVFAVNG